jgi:hypothetical protein
VTLFSPLSVVEALQQNRISDYWVETGMAIECITWPKLMNNAGRFSPIVQHLWRTSNKFRDDFNRLMTQECVTLEVDEKTDFKTCHLLNLRRNLLSSSATRLDTISDSGLWGLLYYTGYLAVDDFRRELVCACSKLSTSADRSAVWLYLPNSQRRSHFPMA